MDREFRSLAALSNRRTRTASPASLSGPRRNWYGFFYYGNGRRPRIPRPGLPGLSNLERSQYFDDYIRILAAIHAVDFDSIGLSDFGRPNGYLERQVNRWSQQYEASKTEDIPAMDRIIDWLPKNLPADTSISLVHGDYRPGNTITCAAEPRVAAILDWELSTLGHPLADLGYCCAAYHGKISSIGDFSLLDHVALGIPTEEEFVAKYCEYSGRSKIDNAAFYVIFSLFRSAAIIQGVYKRGLDGNASSDQALMFGEMAKARASTAWVWWSPTRNHPAVS